MRLVEGHAVAVAGGFRLACRFLNPFLDSRLHPIPRACDFPHHALLLTSWQGLWDLSHWAASTSVVMRCQPGSVYFRFGTSSRETT